MFADLFCRVVVFDHVFEFFEMVLKNAGFHAVVIAEVTVTQVGSDLQATVPAFADGDPMQRVFALSAEGRAE